MKVVRKAIQILLTNNEKVGLIFPNFIVTFDFLYY